MFIPIGSNLPRYRFPFVTVFWFLICCFTFVGVTQQELQQASETAAEDATVSIRGTMTYQMAVVPEKSNSVVNFFSYQFMHASWSHLISNMWFLGIFGWALEAAIGGIFFLFFTLLIGAIAVIPELYLQSDPTLPIIGASGSVAFMMGAVFSMLPRLRTQFVVLFMPGSFFVPIRYLVYFWLSLQISGLAMHLWVEPKPVAYATHLTGFALGMLIGLVFSRKEKDLPFVDVELSGGDLQKFYGSLKAFQQEKHEEATVALLELSERRPWMVNLQLHFLHLSIHYRQRELADKVWKTAFPALVSLGRAKETEKALTEYLSAFDSVPPMELPEQAQVGHLIRRSDNEELKLRLKSG